MNIMFDINHPAHVHQFKHIIKILSQEHRILVVARFRECVHELLEEFHIKYVARKGYNTWIGKIFGMFKINYNLYMLAKTFQPDILVGASGNIYVTHVGVLLNKPSIIFDDTEDSFWQKKLSFPFATTIVTPNSYQRFLGKKHKMYAGMKSQAYLEPRYFQPSKPNAIFDDNIKTVLVRLISWNAIHDIGRKNRCDVVALVKKLKQHENIKVIISAEGAVSKELKPYVLSISCSVLHHILYYADVVISEGYTTATESAILGTYTVCINQKLKLGYFEKLIADGLVICDYNVDSIYKKVVKYLEYPRKRDILSPDLDINQFMIDEIMSTSYK